MRLLLASIVLTVFVPSTTPSSQELYAEEFLPVEDGGFSDSVEDPPQRSRILGFLKGWKGDGHPLTEFGKIHIIKRPGGWGGGGGDQHYGDGGGLHHGHGGDQGWGWGQYGNGWKTTYHVTGAGSGWKKAPKKSWFKKKSFGIHVKGGIGLSFGGKKGRKKGQTVIVQHAPTGWGWNNGYGHRGWGWGGGGGHGGGGHGHGFDDHYGGDYYDDDGGQKAKEGEADADEDVVQEDSDDGNHDDQEDHDEEERRRMDLTADYLYDY